MFSEKSKLKLIIQLVYLIQQYLMQCMVRLYKQVREILINIISVLLKHITLMIINFCNEWP